MSDVERHALAIRDRGLGHQHRWAPECACGWVGRFKRRRQMAEVEYHAHVGKQRPSSYRTGVVRRRPTPTRRLPKELR
jgi:hypothetical protein